MGLNEIAQWIAIGAVLLGVVGLYAYIARHAEPSEGDLATISGPAIGKRVPDWVRRELNGRTAVSFVSEGCPACRRLLGKLLRSPAELRRQRLVVGSEVAAQLVDDLAGADVAVLDVNGSRWSELALLATPLTIEVDSSGVVRAKWVGVSLEPPRQERQAMQDLGLGGGE